MVLTLGKLLYDTLVKKIDQKTMKINVFVNIVFIFIIITINFFEEGLARRIVRYNMFSKGCVNLL